MNQVFYLMSYARHISSDFAYFALLGIVGVCALVVPFLAKVVLTGRNQSLWPFLLGFACFSGIFAALPFGNVELFWLPVIAVIYFGAVLIGTAFSAVSRIISLLTERETHMKN